VIGKNEPTRRAGGGADPLTLAGGM